MPDCARCFFDGFFDCEADENDRAYLQDYAMVMIEKSNFTYVAEADGRVVGFISGVYPKAFSPALAKKHDVPPRWGKIIKFTLRYYLKGYHLSRGFSAAYDFFYAQMLQRRHLPVGKCDCELAALSSRRDYRRGVGTALLSAFVERCRQDGATSTRLFTNTNASYTFYEKRGFACVGEHPYAIDGAEGKSLVYELRFD